MLRKIKKAQSTAEYAILLGVVIAAAVAMQVYLKRGLQARVKSGTDALTSINYTFSEDVDGQQVSADFYAQRQYEPYYLESNYLTYQASRKNMNVDNSYAATLTRNEISARGAGGYQTQHGLKGRTSYEDLWNEE